MEKKLEEFQDWMKILEDQMSMTERNVKQHKTTQELEVFSKATVQRSELPIFDDKVPLEEYRMLIETAAVVNIGPILPMLLLFACLFVVML